MPDDLPLSARVAQTLVAYTIECDNAFELKMGKAGFPEYGLSLVSWLNFMQHVGAPGVELREIMDRTFVTQSQAAQVAGTLERWFLIEVATGKQRGESRTGWGTSKGITAASVVTPREQGLVAIKAWPKVVAEVDARWAQRLGTGMARLRSALAAAAESAGVDMPHGVPSGWFRGDWRQFPPASAPMDKKSPLGALLSRALLALTIEFERDYDHPLALCANTVRVLSSDPIPVRRVGPLCGLPIQMASVQCTEAARRGLAKIEVDAASKGKRIRLTAAGTAAQSDYADRSSRHDDLAPKLRTAINALWSPRGVKTIAAALTPPKAVARGGAPAPPLGLRTELCRRKGVPAPLGPAQEARNKELVQLTGALVADPSATLPHYPVWDQNGGFGP